MADSQEQAREQLYKIGAVSKITGLPQETIRTWERRYALITPERTDSGLRLYRSHHIAKLQLIRTLSQNNESVADLASLTVDELQERLNEHSELNGTAFKTQSLRHGRVGVIGTRLHHQILAARKMSQLQWNVGFSFECLQSYWETSDGSADIIVVELSALGRPPNKAIEDLLARTKASKAVVVFDYMTKGQREALKQPDVSLLRFTPSLAELEQHVLATCAFSLRDIPEDVKDTEAVEPVVESPQPRRFDEAKLAWLREMSSSVKCECPRQLSAITTSLTAFEDYSRLCQTENPEDKEFHRQLELGTAKARLIMEELIVKVCQHENIPID